MANVSYSRRVRSNNLSIQTEEAMKEVLSEIMPHATNVSAEFVECFNENNETYHEDGYMDISITIENTKMSEHSLYYQVDEELELRMIYPE